MEECYYNTNNPEDGNVITQETHICEKEDCDKTAICCHLVDYGDFKSEPKDEYEWLCPEHAHEAGYCPGCGEFWAGVTLFDLRGLCDNCYAEAQDMEEDYEEPWW